MGIIINPRERRDKMKQIMIKKRKIMENDKKNDRTVRWGDNIKDEESRLISPKLMRLS